MGKQKWTPEMKEAARLKALDRIHNQPKPEKTKTQEEIDEHKRMREPDPKFDRFFDELMNPYSKLNMEIAIEKTYKPGDRGYVDPTVDAVTGRKFSELALEEARAKRDEPKGEEQYERAYLEATSPKGVTSSKRK